MIVQGRFSIPDEALAELCQRYHVRELAVFGSALRDDFRDDSDIDILVEFEPGAPIGLFELVALKHELTDLIRRDVDLVEKAGLKRFVRDPVLRSTEVIYVARPPVPAGRDRSVRPYCMVFGGHNLQDIRAGR